jgi:hypothetical protein
MAAALIKRVRHIVLIIMGSMLPLGWVLSKSCLLSRPFAYTALPVGATRQVFGLHGVLGRCISWWMGLRRRRMSVLSPRPWSGCCGR